MTPEEVDLLDAAVATMAARHDGPALTDALDGFGWLDLLADAPEVAVPRVLAAQGRFGAWSAAFHDVLAAQVGQLEPGLGPASVTVVLPPPRASTAGRARGEAAAVDGLAVGARPGRDWLVVVATDPDGDAVEIRVAASDIPAPAVHGLDPGLHVSRLRGDVPAGAVVLARGAAASAWWSAAEVMGRRALCHHLGAAMGEMLQLAITHARERVQFGQPIGVFQAVRHRLAEAHVAVSAAEAAADAAWDSDDPGLAAATAKLVTSRAGAVTVQHCQQILAGIGFTAEHPFPRVMKRFVVLDRLLGSATDLAPIVGRRLTTAGTAPRLVEL